MKGLYQKVIKGDYLRIPNMYSDHLSNVISMCLQVTPTRRPTAAQLLRKKEVVLHLRENHIEEDKFQGSNSLLDTIKLPSNFKLLKDRLPTSKYTLDAELSGDEEPQKLRNFSARGRESNLSLKLLEKE
jgi:NIMA (never in mitosis gene a)-related kinase 1/4/5